MALSQWSQERQYGLSRRPRQRVPLPNDQLQLRVKRCQELTLEALKVQRICSAALFAILAIA